MSDFNTKPRLSLPPRHVQERRPFKPHAAKPKKDAPGPIGHQKLLADAVANGTEVLIEFADTSNINTKLLGADAFSVTYAVDNDVVVVFKHHINMMLFAKATPAA